MKDAAERELEAKNALIQAEQEVQRLAKKAEEDRVKKVAEEKKAAEDLVALKEQQQAEEDRAKKERQRKAAEQKAEEDRLAQEEQRQAEEDRAKQEQQRKAAEQKAEEDRLAQEELRQAEEDRVKKEQQRKATEQKAEEDRLAQEELRQAEEDRVRKEQQRKAAEQKAEEDRVKKEQQEALEEKRKAQEQKAEQKAQEQKADEEKQKADEAKQKAQEQKAEQNPQEQKEQEHKAEQKAQEQKEQEQKAEQKAQEQKEQEQKADEEKQKAEQDSKVDAKANGDVKADVEVQAEANPHYITCPRQFEVECGVSMLLTIGAIVNEKNVQTVIRIADGVQATVEHIDPPAPYQAVVARARLTNFVMQQDERCADPDHIFSTKHLNFANMTWVKEPANMLDVDLSYKSLRTLRPFMQLDGEVVDACLALFRKQMDSTTHVLPVHSMESVHTDTASYDGDYTIAKKGLSRYLPDLTKNVRVKTLLVPVCQPTTQDTMGHYYLIRVSLSCSIFLFPFDVFDSSANFPFLAAWSPVAASERLRMFLIHLGLTPNGQVGDKDGGEDQKEVDTSPQCRIKSSQQKRASPPHSCFAFFMFCCCLCWSLL